MGTRLLELLCAVIVDCYVPRATRGARPEVRLEVNSLELKKKFDDSGVYRRVVEGEVSRLVERQSHAHAVRVWAYR
eukprot:scaffold164942_cov49-Tisochrysis_lutea.AAC.1